MLGLEAVTLEIRRAEDIGPALEGAKGRADALYVAADPLANSNRVRFNTLALAARLPTMHGVRDYVDAGGLTSYGDGYRRAADYVDKILRGAKPGDIPVEQPTKFELVMNLKTAKALGLTVAVYAARTCRRGGRIKMAWRSMKHSKPHVLSAATSWSKPVKEVPDIEAKAKPK